MSQDPQKQQWADALQRMAPRAKDSASAAPEPAGASPAHPTASGRGAPGRAAAPQRPATPTPANSPATLRPELTLIEDDDTVLIPAPQRMLGPDMLESAAVRGGTRSLFLRRTMIPILLTCGSLLPALAAMWFASDADSVVRRTGVWLPVTFVLLGLVFLLLAVVNMAQVKHMMGGARD